MNKRTLSVRAAIVVCMAVGLASWQRPRAQSAVADASQLVGLERLPIAFAVVDAGSPGGRAVSAWFDMILEGGTDAEKAQHASH